jgi:pimeloyl-ACP methyl ester carboxylesterase
MYYEAPDGTRLFCTDAGPGRAVLLLPGWTCDSNDWSWQAPGLLAVTQDTFCPPCLTAPVSAEAVLRLLTAKSQKSPDGRTDRASMHIVPISWGAAQTLLDTGRRGGARAWMGETA